MTHSMLAAALAVIVVGVRPTDYRAALSGSDEVPPVATSAAGNALFHWDGVRLSYRVDATGVHGVTATRLHVGPGGLNGPAVADLYGHEPVAERGGVIASGTIDPGSLMGPLAGQSIGRLVAAMDAGSTYVNVSTARNPTGQLRGTIQAR